MDNSVYGLLKFYDIQTKTCKLSINRVEGQCVGRVLKSVDLILKKGLRISLPISLPTDIAYYNDIIQLKFKT